MNQKSHDSPKQVTHSGITIIEGKQSALGLYVTAAEAYERWKKDPENVMILDVRTLEEYAFVGHPEMAVNLPIAEANRIWDEEKSRFKITPNANFVAQVKEWAQPGDEILIMCRSGGRSAIACNLLAKAGFTNVYNIIDGMEGDLIDDLENVFNGKRMKNGWKNSGVPWTYKTNREQFILTGNLPEID